MIFRTGPVCYGSVSLFMQEFEGGVVVVTFGNLINLTQNIEKQLLWALILLFLSGLNLMEGKLTIEQ